MNRIEFIKTLSSKLSYVMKPDEVRELVDYYDEMILDLMEEGMSEEAAVAQLDSPEKIIETIKETPLVLNLPIKKKLSPLLFAILIVGFPLWGSIALSVILVVLSVYIVIWCIPFLAGSLAFAGVLGGLVSVVLSPFATMDGLHIGLTQFGIGLFLFGAGILFTMLTLSISNTFIAYSKSMTNKIKKILFNQRSVASI